MRWQRAAVIKGVNAIATLPKIPLIASARPRVGITREIKLIPTGW